MKFSPEVNLEVFLHLYALWSRDTELRMKEIDELVANLFCLDK